MSHIKLTSDEARSWCGVPLSGEYYHFKDAEAAALHGLYPGDTELCPDCVQKIIECLEKKRGKRNEESHETESKT